MQSSSKLQSLLYETMEEKFDQIKGSQEPTSWQQVIDWFTLIHAVESLAVVCLTEAEAKDLWSNFATGATMGDDAGLQSHFLDAGAGVPKVEGLPAPEEPEDWRPHGG